MELPVGYRFHPTKEELVNCYLKGRVRGHLHHQPCIIPDVDICSYDPWALPGIFHDQSIIGLDDQVRKWWFFSPHTPQKLDRTHVLCRLKLKRDKKANNSNIESEYLAALALYLDQPDHEYSIDKDFLQAKINSLRGIIDPENQVEFPRQPQPAPGSQNNRLASDIHQLMNTLGPSVMDMLFENDLTDEDIQLMFGRGEEDEDVGDMQNADHAYADFPDDFMLTEDVLMNRQAQTTDSVSGFVPVEEKKGIVEKKFNGSPFASEKPMLHPETVVPRRPMAPPVRPASVKCYSKDEERRFEKFKKETAVINIKPERISLDEAAARAKVLGYKERGSAGNSTKKTNSKEIEFSRGKSNSVAASTGTTSESTKTSTNPPLANLVNVLIRIFLLLTIACLVLNF